MNLGKNITGDYKDGVLKIVGETSDKMAKITLEVEAAKAILPVIEDIRAKVNSGELDLIPKTDLEKPYVLLVLDAVEKYAKGGEKDPAAQA